MPRKASKMTRALAPEVSLRQSPSTPRCTAHTPSDNSYPRPHGRIIPTTLALQTVRFFHLDMHPARAIARTLHQRNRGNDKQIAQLISMSRQYRINRLRSRDNHLRLQPRPDQLIVARLFQRLEHFVAHRAQRCPVIVVSVRPSPNSRPGFLPPTEIIPDARSVSRPSIFGK